MNHLDIVTTLPPDPPAKHVGEVHYIEADGGVVSSYDRWAELKALVQVRFRDLFDGSHYVRRDRLPDRLDHSPESLADHSPSHYAYRMRSHALCGRGDVGERSPRQG